MLSDLLDQIPQDEQLHSVYTDGAYDTKQCRQAIADRQAQAVIPPRKNAKPWKDKKMCSLERNEPYRDCRRHIFLRECRYDKIKIHRRNQRTSSTFAA